MPPEVTSAYATLAGLRPARMLADLPPPQHDPAQAREAADRVLARPEYQWSDDRGVLERLGEWVADQVGRLTTPFGVGAGGLSVWVGWVVLVLLAVAVALLIYRARAGWRRDRVRAAGVRGQVVVSADDGTVDWAAEVLRCEAEGRWREALRARYRVLVSDLARRRIIGDLVGRTTGELVAEVDGTAPRVAPPFRGATALFEGAWYGGVPVDPAERDRFVRLADDARSAADGSPSRSGVTA